jgi:hypothetical protein
MDCGDECKVSRPSTVSVLTGPPVHDPTMNHQNPTSVMVNADGEYVVSQPDQASWESYQKKAGTANIPDAPKGNEELRDKSIECSMSQKQMRDDAQTPSCSTVYCKEFIQNAPPESAFGYPLCDAAGIPSPLTASNTPTLDYNGYGYVPGFNGGTLGYNSYGYVPGFNGGTLDYNGNGYVPGSNGGALDYNGNGYVPGFNGGALDYNGNGYVPGFNGGALDYNGYGYVPGFNGGYGGLHANFGSSGYGPAIGMEMNGAKTMSELPYPEVPAYHPEASQVPAHHPEASQSKPERQLWEYSMEQPPSCHTLAAITPEIRAWAARLGLRRCGKCRKWAPSAEYPAKKKSCEDCTQYNKVLCTRRAEERKAKEEAAKSDEAGAGAV